MTQPEKSSYAPFYIAIDSWFRVKNDIIYYADHLY